MCHKQWAMASRHGWRKKTVFFYSSVGQQKGTSYYFCFWNWYQTHVIKLNRVQHEEIILGPFSLIHLSLWILPITGNNNVKRFEYYFWMCTLHVYIGFLHSRHFVFLLYYLISLCTYGDYDAKWKSAHRDVNYCFPSLHFSSVCFTWKPEFFFNIKMSLCCLYFILCVIF